jgi:hypothetical protein
LKFFAIKYPERKFYLQIEIKQLLTYAEERKICHEIMKMVSYKNIIIGVYASEKWYGYFRRIVQRGILNYFIDLPNHVMEYHKMIEIIKSNGNEIEVRNFY